MAAVPQIIGLLVSGWMVFFVTFGAAEDGLARNGLVGIRTRWSMRSDDAWRATHETFKPYAVACAVVSVVHALAIVVTAFVGDSRMVSTALAICGYACLFGIGFFGMRAAKRAAEGS
ncbi:SdpI family protein [Microbacterium sp. NPDC096154]|uniref:SdpI family protein n=1 Tax=Microbacterium sp. NPDC096154 TaxID=3155549 RepID=UPI003326CA57